MKIVVVTLLIIMVLVLGLLAYRNTTNKMPDLPLLESSSSADKKDKKSKKEVSKEEPASSNSLQVIQRWEMPEVLTEVSDISHIGDNSVACIQDEMGTIFIYNKESNKVEKEIPFAGSGDYEGLALVGNTAYVINSSGVLYQVNDINKSKPTVKEHKTFLTEKHDVEALCYDKGNNRLLVAFKGEEGNGSTKGVYSFDLKSKKLAKEPVHTIDLEDVVSGDTDGKKRKQKFQPSAIAIHPASGDIYLTEGTNPRLLILDKQGKFKSLIPLDEKVFAQPEGITINPAGEIFISNEGKKKNGNILKVEV